MSLTWLHLLAAVVLYTFIFIWGFMQNALIFISSNYPYLLLMGIGYFLTQQTSPILGLLRGLRFEDGEKVVMLINQGVKLIDVRDEAAYAQGHIKGALSHPLVKGNLPKKARGDTYIAYNQNGRLSYKEISQLKAIGIDNLIVLSGGIQAWQNAGIPLKTRSK